MGRPRIYTPEEAEERKRSAYLKYLKKRYREDSEFREQKKALSLVRYHENKKNGDDRDIIGNENKEMEIKKYKTGKKNIIVIFKENGDIIDNLNELKIENEKLKNELKKKKETEENIKEIISKI